MLLRSHTQTMTRSSEVQKRNKRPAPCIEEHLAPSPKRQRNPRKVVRAELTAANLVRHTTRLFADMPQNKKRSHGGTSIGTSRTKTSDPHFGQALVRNGVVHEPLLVKKPTDWDEIKRDLEKSRASGSPTSGDFRLHMFKVMHSENEATLVAQPFSTLAKQRVPDLGRPYYPTLNQEWTEIEETSVTEGLSRPKPDYSEAFAIQSYPAEVADDLGGAIQPTSYNSAMPRFAVEMKRRGGGEGAQHQSAYDGAVMVEAAQKQLQYLGQAPQPMKTEALTATYNGRTLDIYANHVVESSKGLQYHQTLVSHHMLESTHAEFSAGWKHLRNAQDWAYQRASDACDALNEKREEQNLLLPSPPATTAQPSPPVETMTNHVGEPAGRQRRIKKPRKPKREVQS